MSEPTHTITVTVTSNYLHGGKQITHVMVLGAGDLDHYLTAMRAILVASGWAPETAAGLHFEEA
jgi:hypothetical protein